MLVQNGNTQVPEEVPAANVIDTKRNLFQTLVFGPPAGTPLKMMTWNIKRFTSFMHFVEGLGNAGAFDDSQVPPQLIGQFIAPMDVVALQEAWDDDDLTKILDAANAARAASNQPPFFKIGPIDFPKGQGISFDSTTGGVYILSKFPATEIDFKIYDACRGEDCLKAKGVLHARLNFSTTDVGGTANAAGRPLPGQKPDDFVDVYATHMQADELVCTSDAIETAVHNEVAIGLACSAIDPFFFAACLIADELLAGFHCDDFPDDQTVRDKQMDQMNAFIASTADRTRPAIVMGDFNTDTRNLNNDGTGHYGKILQQLHIGNVGSDPNDKAPDDRLNPWPIGFGFPWQVDHSDVGRETFSDSFWIDFGRGTDIGATDPDDPPPGSMVQTKLQRLDHVILRPGAQPGSSAFGNVTWMAGKPTNGSAVWASPWPLAASPINTVGNRMSDHKPVVFSFQMVPFKPAPKFHPGWNQTSSSA